MSCERTTTDRYCQILFTIWSSLARVTKKTSLLSVTRVFERSVGGIEQAIHKCFVTSDVFRSHISLLKSLMKSLNLGSVIWIFRV